ELEPARGPQPLEALVGRERVAADPPATFLVDLVGQPVRDQVGIGGHVEAVDADVVRRVGDHREIGPDQLLHPRGKLRAARAAGEHRDPHQRSPLSQVVGSPATYPQGSPSGSPVIRSPAWTLYRALIEMRSGVS